MRINNNKYRSRILLLLSLIICAISVTCGKNDFVENEIVDTPEEQKKIVLTANDCFFYPIGNLSAVEESRVDGTPYNKGWKLSHITGWSKKGDTIIWALKNCSKGELIVTPEMSVLPKQDGAEINVLVNDNRKTIVLKSTQDITNYQKQNSAYFQLKDAGNYTVKLVIKKSNSEGNIGDLLSCQISGTAAENAEIWNRRWRPLAVHCQWRSTKNPENVVLAIHENIIHTTDVHMYQPTTTPFGYTGSTWEPKTQNFGGYNFSLWSYGANEQEPPLEQFSHLIAVGPGYTFGEYGHEGTGVKPRGENPYKNYKTNKQVVAVRKEPGIPYDTYYSYYLHPETNRWTLYGCGRKFNKKSEISYLTTGAFVEEPGPPTRTRNGHIMREVHFSAWLMDEQKSWYPVDVMKHKGDDSSLSYKNWGVKEGKFFMQMGGINENVVEPGDVILSNPLGADKRPEYLKSESFEDLFKLPVEKIEALQPEDILNNEATIVLDCAGIGNVTTAEVFWGENNALTFDYKWANTKEISIVEGITKIQLDNLLATTKYFYQIRIINEKGTVWMMDTQHFTTP